MATENKDKLEKRDFEDLGGNVKFKVSGYGYRHQQTLVVFLCLSTAYSMRACMGVALVVMVDDVTKNHSIADNLNHSTGIFNYTTDMSNYTTYIANYSTDVFNNTNYSNHFNGMNFDENATFDGDLAENKTDGYREFKSTGIFNAMLLKGPYPKFRWSKKIQDTVQSSFFWGYMMLQIPGGHLVHKFGARRLLTAALTINSIVSFIFPWLAFYGGWICAAISRFVQGLSQACIVPGIHSFFGRWAPLEERARLVGFANSGQALGTVIGIPITAFLAASALGWPGIFRFYGLLSGACACLFYYVIADAPALHAKISDEERRYIEEGLGLKEGETAKKLPIPWRSILRSRAVYAMMVAHIGQTWGQVTLFTEVPTFMARVMDVNIKANGLLTALPFLVMWFTSFFFNWFTDMIIVKKYLSVTNARKVANFIGCVPPCIGLIVLAFAPKNIYVVESLLVFICAFKISSHVGFLVNHIDLTPNFAGTTMSLSNFVSNCVGSQAPLVAGFILSDPTSEQQWRYVFFVAAALYFMSNLVYMVLGTADKAPWNDPPQEMDRQETLPMIHVPEHKKTKC